MKKLIIGIFIIFICLVIGFLGIKSFVKSKLTDKLISIMENQKQQLIYINYTSLSDNCEHIMDICLTLSDVTIKYDRFPFYAGNVSLSLSLIPPFQINVKNKIDKPYKNTLISDIKYHSDIIRIQNAHLSFEEFKADFQGIIDLKNKNNSYLNATTLNLKKTIYPYISQNIQPFLGWMFQDTQQDVKIYIKNEWIMINSVPIIPYLVIDQKFFSFDPSN